MERAKYGFVETIFEAAMVRGVSYVQDSLVRPYDSNRARWKDISVWFDSLTPDEQEKLLTIVREGIIDSLTTVFVSLDGASGYHLVDEVPCEFAVTVREYVFPGETHEPDSVEICPPSRGEDLHDIFLNMVDDHYSLETDSDKQ